MEYLVGALLALGVGAFGATVGLDRERGFYPVMLAVIASYYVLFAVMGGSMSALVVEACILGGFLAVSVAGFNRSLWLVAAALFGHGALDLVHPHLIANPGAPSWWPMFCMAFDMVAAGWLAMRLLTAPAGSARLAGAGLTSRGGFPRDQLAHSSRTARPARPSACG